MKKLFIITVLMALATNGFAQILHYDFSAVCETGQTLYYLITNEEEHTVMLTYPYSEENAWFHGNYYEGHPKPEGEIILPSIVNHNDVQYSIIAIDNNTFAHCTDLTGTLTIPEGIVSVGSHAFGACSFTSISIPISMEAIMPTAFAYCASLESIFVDDENPIFYSENNAIIRREGKVLVQGCKTTVIPNDIETIGNSAFEGAGDGGNLIIPNSVTSINDDAFTYCNFSGTITLSESLQHIGLRAFNVSHFSGSLTIPNSVIEIGARAFGNCSNLTGNLTLPSSISTIKTATFYGAAFSGSLIIPNSVTNIDLMAFEYTNFSELVLGNSVATIDNHAFNHCNNLTGALMLPASLTEIGLYAFANTSFNEIYSPNTTPPTLGDTNGNNVFDGCDRNIPVHIPLGCTEVYQNARGWDYFNNFIESEMNLEGEWYYEIQNDDGSITYQHLEYSADTTIGTSRPKIIIRSNTQYDRDTLFTTVTHEYVYEENEKVYWWNKDLEEFTMLYDLTAQTGDEWEIKVGTESLIMHVDTVEYYELNGLNYRMLRVSDENDLFSGEILCSIGHMTSFFPEKLMNRNANFIVDGLRCYWVNDILLYHNGEDDCDAIYSELHGLEEDGPSTGSGALTVYPNPTNGVLFVETHGRASQPNQTYRITNLMGQTILSGNITAENQQINIEKLPAGMYFITFGDATQKFVVK